MENMVSMTKWLVTPLPTKDTVVRRVKSFDVAMLVDYAVAQNVCGNTTIPLEAIGAPYRLRTNKAGVVQFSQTGKPSVRVAKEIVAFGTMIHNNIVSAIVSDTSRVYAEKEAEVKAMIAAAAKAGAPIINSDNTKLTAAIAARAKAEADAAAAANDGHKTDVPERELVGATT